MQVYLFAVKLKQKFSFNFQQFSEKFIENFSMRRHIDYCEWCCKIDSIDESILISCMFRSAHPVQEYSLKEKEF